MRRVLVLCIALVALLGLAPPASAGPIGFSVQSNGDDHLYAIDLATGVAVDLGLVGLSDAEGLTWVGGTLFGIGGTVGEFWDLTSPPGSLVGLTGPRSGIDAGLADSPSGTVYNLNAQSGSSSLYTINTSTGAASLVGSGAFFADGFAISAAGLAFGADSIFNNGLYSVNLATGAGTFIGGFGFTGGGQAGMDFDVDGVLWMLLSNGAIYRVNTATGVATFSAQTLSGFEGLAIQQTVVPEPASLLLLGSGLLGAAVRSRRRRR